MFSHLPSHALFCDTLVRNHLLNEKNKGLVRLIQLMSRMEISPTESLMLRNKVTAGIKECNNIKSRRAVLDDGLTSDAVAGDVLQSGG